MTAKEAREELDQAAAAIDWNVAEWIAGRIDYAEFGARQRAAHDSIHAAGMSDAWMRRWRRANPVGA